MNYRKFTLCAVAMVLVASLFTVPLASADPSSNSIINMIGELKTLVNSVLSKLGAVQILMTDWFSQTGTYHNVAKITSGNGTIYFTQENNPNIVIMERSKPFKVTVTAYAFGMDSPETFILRYHVGQYGDGFYQLTQADNFDVHTYEFVTTKFYIYGIVGDGFTAFYSYFIEYSD